MSALRKPHVLIIGTDPEGMGGVASVFQAYRAGGLFEHWPVDHLVTHVDGGKWLKLLVFLRSLLRFGGWMLLGKGQILHIHTSSRASFYRKAVFVWLGRLCGRRVILHLHGAEFMLFYRDEAGPLLRGWIRVTFASAHRTVVLSSQWAEQAREFAPGTRVAVIHNPVVVPVPMPDPAGREAATLLFLGRVGERKGAWELFESVSRLVLSHPDVRLWMGGDGELAEARRRLDALDLGQRVDLLGWLRGADKEDLLSRATLYVLPSHNEGLPMGVLEAMAWGLPVVATDVGGTREAIPDGRVGLLLQPGHPAELDAALDRLLRDPNLRVALGRAAHDHALSHFNVPRILAEIDKLYTDLLPFPS